MAACGCLFNGKVKSLPMRPYINRITALPSPFRAQLGAQLARN